MTNTEKHTPTPQPEDGVVLEPQHTSAAASALDERLLQQSRELRIGGELNPAQRGDGRVYVSVTRSIGDVRSDDVVTLLFDRFAALPVGAATDGDLEGFSIQPGCLTAPLLRGIAEACTLMAARLEAEEHGA